MNTGTVTLAPGYAGGYRVTTSERARHAAGKAVERAEWLAASGMRNGTAADLVAAERARDEAARFSLLAAALEAEGR